MPPYFVFKNVNDRGPVDIDEELSIGRHPNSDLQLNEKKVSRHHCTVREEEQQYYLEDLNSSNGTYVNDQQIDQHKLEEGDRIQVGGFSLEFTWTLPEHLQSETEASEDSDDLSSRIEKEVDDIPSQYTEDLSQSIANHTLVDAAEEAGPEQAERDSRIDQFKVLFKLGREINKKMELDEVLKTTVRVIEEVFSPRRCVILTDPSAGDPNQGGNKELVPQIVWNRSGDFIDTNNVNISWTITHKAVEDQISLVSTDASTDARFKDARSVIQNKIQSVMCVPLWEQDEVFGAIYVDSGREGRTLFEDEDLNLLTAIGNQVAIRIKQEQLFEQLKQEAIIRQNFERFHSPDVTEAILEHAREGEKLPQELSQGEISILFVDIKKFSTMAELLEPMKLADVLNRFYDSMSEIVFDHKGGVNKYIGDSVMAVFGAPIPDESHPSQAVRAGRDMVEVAEQLNRELPINHQFQVRVGVNSGPVVYGYVGSSEVKEFTVLGDPVNVADRLEGLADPNSVCVGERTAELTGDDLQLEPLEPVQVKGKEKKIQVYRA